MEKLSIVPDFKIVAEEIFSKKIENNEISPSEIIIHESMLYFLEKLSKENHTLGNIGMDELEKLTQMQSKYGFTIEYKGRRALAREIKELTEEELDRQIRDVAYDEGGTLLTSTPLNASLARAKHIPVIFEERNRVKDRLGVEAYFDENTMSVHLKEGVPPYAKKGGPGGWKFVEVNSEKLSQEFIQQLAREIIEEAEIRKEGFIETERFGSTIVQIDRLRIVITKPPFSDGWEITVVRPVRKLKLEDYQISEQLKARLNERAEGVLIAGSPGMGKTTFAAALAEEYADKDKIVKTVEAPRDLALPENITQYSISHGSKEELHDILLLSRPDYTIFDELRNVDDFGLFSDLRLAGIGFIGVVHATKAIDAIQRFVGKIELGVIPQIIDTVIFIKEGGIEKVLSLEMIVKVPAGMTEADLARPVVQVKDFETQTPEYEMYTYGEQTVVIAVEEGKEESPIYTLAKRQLEKEFRSYGVKKVEMLSENKCRIYVPEENISKIIGKQGKRIAEIEQEIGIKIDVQAAQKDEKTTEELAFSFKITGKNIVFEVEPEHINKNVQVYVEKDYLLSAQVSKKGMIKVKKSNKIGRILSDALNTEEQV
ncbi:MAG: PINc/VapC family ATPase, partial [Candidatus Nanoarchaeia archaeon]